MLNQFLLKKNWLNFLLSLQIFCLVSGIIACKTEHPESDQTYIDTTEVNPTIDVESPAYGVYQILKISAPTEVSGYARDSAIKAKGYELKINGNANVQLFEYDSPESLISATNSISSDGKKINNVEIVWGGTPHFYKTDRVLIKYVGDDKSVLSVLENISVQFAGG